MAAPVQHYDPSEDLAIYDATQIEYLIDAGTYLECPKCGHHVPIDTAVDQGDNLGCGRGPWSVTITVDNSG